MYLLGYDIGSSFIKARLVSADTGKRIGSVRFPEREMTIQAPQAHWAEQNPEEWWSNLCQATRQLLDHFHIDPQNIQGIGMAYQMHGLVLVDKNLQVLRPAIIWCDSRAVEIGRQACEGIGPEKCLSHFLNSPGNFTASKLKWVKDHQPEVYEKIHKMMLPGDYIAMKLTGEINTTVSGLSEGVLWDFKENGIAYPVLDYFGLQKNLLPEIVPAFSIQGRVSQEAATATGLQQGTPISYRAGDQPNNALSLNVMEPGEIAATGGTSGVVYSIVDRLVYDPQSRVNGFAHVNHQPDQPRIGILLCINGAGIQYRWMKQQLSDNGTSYEEMERLVASVPVGSEGLRIVPFGNGAERMLDNQNPGAQINNLQFNRHTRAHIYRSGLEGIAFSFVYGIRILDELGLPRQIIRVGNDNLFQSETFSTTIANLLGVNIQVIDTNGAQGAAKAAGVATGVYASIREATSGGEVVKTYEPTNQNGIYEEAYRSWIKDLEKLIT